MKKLSLYAALIPLIILSLTPPWTFALSCNINSLIWLWAVFTSGFLTFLFLYQKVSVWLKLFLIWAFIGCFISRAPYLSFTMFWTLIVCAYYYALCLKIDDFAPVKKTIQAIFFFVTLLIIMQCFGLDTLLNFNQKVPVVLGTIGNRMILSSFVCILAPFLIFTPLNWIPLIIISFISQSSGAVFSLGAGGIVYAWAKFKKLRIAIISIIVLVAIIFVLKTSDWTHFIGAGRLPVWKRTAELILKEPLGYGIATYKVLFPILSEDLPSSQPVADSFSWRYEGTSGRGMAWRRTHNSWLQLPFEAGIPGFILFLGFIISIVIKVKDPVKLSGLVILGANMCVHFPDRMVQSVLIMIMFLAFCEINTNQRKGFSNA